MRRRHPTPHERKAACSRLPQAPKWFWILCLTASAVILYALDRHLAATRQEVQPAPAEDPWQAVYRALQASGIPQARWIRTGDRLQVELPRGTPLPPLHREIEEALKRAKLEILLAKEETHPPRLEIVFGRKGEAQGRIIAASEREVPTRLATVALVLDDAGYGMSREFEALLQLPYKFTVAVIPGLKRTTEVAERVHRAGKEVIVHMPMEPEHGDVEDRGYAIRSSHSPREVAERVRKALAAVPYAKGLNNHEGSRATASLPTMLAVMEELKAKNVFFLDSRTSPESKGYLAARRVGLRALQSAGFLDARDDEDWIRSRLWELVGKSSSGNGIAVIAHPRESTLNVLLEQMPKLAEQGVRFVFASELAN
ncbi:MAG: divergent polysaccharide deacetylase family protein [candidate division KSB1 bacterium]|nr:divergent polysaccharide deacetylase family protein [candidate division KSB1 bacterium]